MSAGAVDPPGAEIAPGSRGPSGREGPHAFVDDLERPELAEDDHHHLGRVVRLRPGDGLTVSDGRGRWRACRFGSPLEPAGEIVAVDRPTHEVEIVFALVKGAKPEWVVQKLTELGVDVITPLVAARSVVRWTPQKAEANTERLRRVAREAAMQCRRVWLPQIDPPRPVAEVARREGAVMAEREGPPLVAGSGPVMIGPEGGWAPEEIDLGLPTVGMGDLVLRAETAAVVAATLLVSARGGWLPATERG